MRIGTRLRPVTVRRRAGDLAARLRYRARAFDPTAQAAPELPASLAEAAVSGVSIAMVRALTRRFSGAMRAARTASA